MPTGEIQQAILAAYQIEAPRLVAALARLTRDLDAAEELAQDALVAALEAWPRTGVPARPGAWLLTAARNRAEDRRRRERRLDARREENARAMADLEAAAPDPGEALDAPFQDDLLRLIFVACHPVLSSEARVALTLRLLGGLETGEIARAFLVTEPTMAQRLVRAKRALAEARVPFDVPPRPEWPERLASVLEVLYLIFNEGYSATRGDDLVRPALCEEALRLGRILAGLAPSEAEVHGLVALMELQASRLGARTGSDGAPVLLLDQHRSRWDRLAIDRGLAARPSSRWGWTWSRPTSPRPASTPATASARWGAGPCWAARRWFRSRCGRWASGAAWAAGRGGRPASGTSSRRPSPEDEATRVRSGFRACAEQAEPYQGGSASRRRRSSARSAALAVLASAAS